MLEREIILPDTGTITIKRDAVQKLLDRGDGTAALLYLYMVSDRGPFSLAAAASALGLERPAAEKALDTLLKLRLVQMPAGQEKPAPQPDETPCYTAADIRRELEQGEAFHQLVKDVQASLGKVLSSDDLVKLFGIYDGLGLPPEVILLLVTHCITQVRARYGAGRTPTMRYIEKAAFTWEREEIFSLEKAEAYIRRLEQRQSDAAKIRAAMQIRDREFTKTEQRYVDEWLAMGFREDAAEIAFDRTVVKTGKLSWSYMNSIMKSWHEKGLHTAEEIRRGDGRRRPSSSGGGKSAAGPTDDDIARMKRILNEIKKGQ